MPFSKEDIQNLLSTKDIAVVRGIEAIYARQTEDEQAAETTSYDNGVGFNGVDANILSSFAKQIIRWRAEKVETGSNRFPFPLSPKQLVLARRKMHKYAAQLAGIANAKEDAVQAESQADAAAERAAIQAVEIEAESEAPPWAAFHVVAAEREAIQAVDVEIEDEFLTLA